MAIKGSLKEASLADVCQLLSLGHKTGCLSVADRSRFGQIYFDKGRITYARIVNRRDRLGDLLVREGIIAQEQLDDVLQHQSREPDKRVGELLVEHRFLTRADLTRFIRIQIEEAIYHLFTWTRGNFFFEVDERPEAADIVVSINPESLLLEAARRVDEWSLIEKKIPSLDLIFEVERERVVTSDVELTAEQQQIVLLLDGTRTVQEIVDETGVTEFDVGKALFGLIQAGFAHRVGRRAEEPGRARDAEIVERRNLGVAFARAGMLDEATREFDRVVELSPHDHIARFHLALIAMRRRDYRDAVRQLRNLLQDTGPNYGAFVNMAVALRRLGRHQDALLVLGEADALRAGTPHVALQRAATLLMAGNFTASAAEFEEYRWRLDELSGPVAPYYYLAALGSAAHGQLHEAERLATEGLQRHPDSAPLLLLEGLLHERRGDLDAADRSYRRALEEDPSIAQAHKNLGDVAYRRGLLDEALDHYRRAAELDPGLGDDVYAKLGNLYFRAHNQEQAVRAWKRALEMNPDNEVVKNNLQIVQADAHA
jgi:tetratricopeptide (TPR) repeat protein